MCAGGLPVANNTNPVQIILAAFEISNFINKFNQNNDTVSFNNEYPMFYLILFSTFISNH